MPEIEKKIRELLEISIISDELKKRWNTRLVELTDDQKNELLGILEEEQKLVQDEIEAVEKENTKIYKQLLIDMKGLASKLTHQFMRETEERDRESEKDILASLDEELNNL